jgi:2',3'-cyclic-nucleotide 2'-phosphodiesterase (5'-nucleotidase family)
MKRSLWLSVVSVVFLASCQTLVPSLSASSLDGLSSSSTSSSVVEIDLYNWNDFHGAVEFNTNNKELGISRIAGYATMQRDRNPNSIFLSSGDMWQGSADSNITRGRLVVDAMNMIGFSAMAIGNHEFDWTDEYLYINQQRSDFPLLGINIIDKRTNQRAGFADPYTMIERQGVKIGIIGTIGSSLESTILASAVAAYDFVPYTNLVIAASQTLKAQGAHLIVLLNHDGQVETGVIPYVDAVFNGHTHRLETNYVSGKPVYQASAYGRAIAHTKFMVNPMTNSVQFLQSQSGVYTYDDLIRLQQFPQENQAVANLYDTYLINDINPIKNEVIGVAEGTFTQANLGRLAVDEMLKFGQQEKPEVVASFHNSGGVRASIASGQVTYGDVYRAFPFDNELVIVAVTGSQLTSWLTQGLYYKTIANLQPIQSQQIYWIIAINFLTEQYTTSFRYPHDLDSTINTFAYIREQLKTRWLAEGTIRASDY